MACQMTLGKRCWSLLSRTVILIQSIFKILFFPWRSPPPYNPLNTDQIQQIRTWINQGAKNNVCHDGCDTTQLTFSETIWPMMQSYCTGCHSSVSPGGGIVIAGNGSLMGSIRYESAYSPMPVNQALSECSITQLQKWIDDGFPQ